MNCIERMLAVAACTAAAFAVGGAIAGEVKVIKAGPALDDMKVTRDKDTGQLRAPNQEEIADLKAQGVTIAPHILELVRPTTTVEVRADGSAVAKRSLADMDNLVLTRGADGKMVMQHARKPAAKPSLVDLPKG